VRLVYESSVAVVDVSSSANSVVYSRNTRNIRSILDSSGLEDSADFSARR